MSKETQNLSDHLVVKHPIPALFDQNSRILILGSFPSIKTREANFFYGHPQNRFWPMVSSLLSVSPALSATEPERARKVLLEFHIALWDSIASCEIIGSSDSSIRNVKPNDFGEIFSTANIRHVFCNGTAAYQYFLQYNNGYPRNCVSKMSSTSPANAAKSLNDLIDEWRVILDYLR